VSRCFHYQRIPGLKQCTCKFCSICVAYGSRHHHLKSKHPDVLEALETSTALHIPAEFRSGCLSSLCIMQKYSRMKIYQLKIHASHLNLSLAITKSSIQPIYQHSLYSLILGQLLLCSKYVPCYRSCATILRLILGPSELGTFLWKRLGANGVLMRCS
jgi:hypothetical protein